MADAIPIDDEPDSGSPADDQLRKKAIPVEQPEMTVAAPAASANAAIPVGSTDDLESRVRARALPIDAAGVNQPPAMMTTARPIPIPQGSTEDLENKSLQTFEHPKSAPIQPGVASLWTKAENIHNPVLRVLGEIGAGGARALDAVGTGIGRMLPVVGAFEQAIPGTTLNEQLNQKREAQQEAQQAELAKEQAGVEQEKAAAGHIQAETEAIPAETNLKKAQTAALENPKPEKPEDVQHIYADAVQDAINRNVDPNSDPKVQQAADAVQRVQKEATPKTPNDFEQYYSDWLKDNNFPDTAHNRLMARQSYARAGQLPQRDPQQLGVIDGKVVALKPGMAVPEGAQSLSGDLKGTKPTADEQRRADLAENLNENLNTLEDIVNRHPSLFGPVSGRVTALKGLVGSDDPDIGALETIKHQIGMAQISAHGMRSAQGVASAADSILNSFKNGPDAVKASLNAARNSVKTFMEDAAKATSKGAQGPTKAGSAVVGQTNNLAPPKDPDPGMKWQHRTGSNGKVEWRQVKAQ